MYTPSPELAEFVQSIPKTETHLHLEGACPFEMIQRAEPGRFKADPPMWDDGFRYDSFDQFMEMYDQFCGSVFNSAEAYHECAMKMLAKCAEQNVKYVETSFHIGALAGGSMTGPELIEAVKSAAPKGMTVHVFMGMCHNDYQGVTKEIIEDSLTWDALYGIDLHGPEYLPLESWTADVWARAGDAGKKLKAHAGEFMPASFVRRCIEELGVKRIQHGVRCVEDEEVVDLILREGVILDVCPISNLKLAVQGVSRMSTHPIRRLFDRGVTCTINSDDPFMFGNTLNEEYYALSTDLGFSNAELLSIARNGFLHADMDDTEKMEYLGLPENSVIPHQL